jgi:hypothetical protein
MTSQRQPHEGRDGKAEGSARSQDERSPMERFQALTKAVISVTREQIREQEKKNKKEKIATD